MALRSGYRRSPGGGDGGGAAVTPADKSVFGKFPELEAFLREETWEDGAARVPGSLIVFPEAGCWKAMLNDKDGGCVAFVAGAQVVDCLGALEKGLARGSLDWRAGKQSGTGKRKG